MTRVAWTIVCGLVVSVFVFTLVVRPALLNARQLQRAAMSAEDERVQLEVLQAHRVAIAPELSELKAQLRRAADEVPDEPDLERVEQTLNELAAKTVGPITITRQAAIDEGSVEELVLRVATTASYHALGVLLDEMGKAKRTLNVTSLRLDHARARDGHLVADAVFEVRAPRFVEKRLGLEWTPKLPVAVREPEPSADEPLLWNFDPGHVRDPFVLDGVRPGVGASRVLTGNECSEPPTGDRVALDPSALDTLQIAYVKLQERRPCAMVIGADRGCHEVRIGEVVGLNRGKVSRIAEDAVTITETIADATTGRVYPVYVALPVPAGRRAPAWFCARR